MYAPSTFEDCANCPVTHTEVSFAHNDKSSSAVYVWMRPTPSDILRIRVEKFCSIISYHGDQKKVGRPVGI